MDIFRNRSLPVVLPFIVVWVLLLSSCASPILFQSDNYIIYKLQSGDTSPMLAKIYLGDENKYWKIEDANEEVPFRDGQTIIIPLKEENIGGLTPSGYNTVPILCYHRFGEKSKSSMCLPAQVFDQQMKYLKENGYRVITLGQLYGFIQYQHAVPKNSVVITLDDGYRSVYDTAYPILKKYGFTATLFVYTDFVGMGKSAITWNQLREIKTDGFEIGSHSLSHPDLTKKRDGENEEAFKSRIHEELFVSKQIIDKKLSQDTIFFAFPYSRYDQSVLSLCEEVGYKLALTVDRGGNSFFTDPLRLKRDQVLRKDLKTFARRLNTFKKASLR